MKKHFKAATNDNTRGASYHRFVLNHAIAKKSKSGAECTPSANYRKSVSPSLVYRPLTLEKRHHVGFKVTYCGKGNRSANFDKRRLSIILIPDENYVRSYRPIAGAIARQTRAEVICCAYQKLETNVLNEELITTLVERIRYERSKLRSIAILSENDNLFEIFKQRLCGRVDYSVNGVEINTPTDELVPRQLELEEAPLSSPEKPSPVLPRRKRIEFVQISREDSIDDSSRGIFKRVLSSLASSFGNLFRGKTSSVEKSQDCTSDSLSNFHFLNKTFIINRNMNLSNSAHCDLIAKLMAS